MSPRWGEERGWVAWYGVFALGVLRGSDPRSWLASVSNSVACRALAFSPTVPLSRVD